MITGNAIIDTTYLYTLTKEAIQSKINNNQIQNLIKGIIASDKSLITEGIRATTKINYVSSIYDLAMSHVEEKDTCICALIIALQRDVCLRTVNNSLQSAISNNCPLSIATDTLSSNIAYTSRISLMNYINNYFTNLGYSSNQLEIILNSFINTYLTIDVKGVFIQILSQCMNQSIVSAAGGSYEDRVLNKLLQSINQNDIDQGPIHDSKINSVEYDFKITIGSKEIGVSAKRTLRERYKQNFEEHSLLDVDRIILVTLGIDLPDNKISNLIQKDYPVFVSDEIYNSRQSLINSTHVYPVSQLTLSTLKTLI